MGKNVFGTVEDVATDPDLSVFGDEPSAPPETETPATDALSSSTAQVPAPEEPAQPAEPAPPVTGEQEPAVETPATEEPRTYAGRFQTVEDMETGYRQLQSHQTRQFEELRAMQERTAQLEDALRQALPFVEQVQRGQLPQAGPSEPLQIDLDDPEKLPQAIEQIVGQRVQEQMQQFQAQMLAQQHQSLQDRAQVEWQAKASRVVDEFRRGHPEVGMGSEGDVALEQIVRSYRMDISDPEQLELAYEVWKNPLIGRNLAANPQWVTSPEGREMARTWGVQSAPAATPSGAASPDTTAASARTRAVAHVETGGTGAPVEAAPGERPQRDEFDDVLDVWKSVSQAKNPFVRY